MNPFSRYRRCPAVRKIFLLSAFIFYALPSYAAPFCVQTQTAPVQCEYVDAAACRKRANELQAICVANPAELKLTPGIGKYCLVDSSRISQCIYTDRTSCEQDAARANGVCIENTTENVQQDPYQSDPNRK